MKLRIGERQHGSYVGAERLDLGCERLTVGAEDAPGTFEGLASKFNEVIQAFVPTIIHPGTFQKTLQENGNRVRVLWQHDVDELIGKPLELRETEAGLYIKGKVSGTPRGQEALTLMRDGVLTDMSIGFDPIRFDFENDEQGNVKMRHIREVALYEVSLVTMGANAGARISAVNSLGNAPLESALKAVLRASEVIAKHSVGEGDLLTLVESVREQLNALLPAAPQPAPAGAAEEHRPQAEAREDGAPNGEAEALGRKLEAMKKLLAMEADLAGFDLLGAAADASPTSGAAAVVGGGT